MTNILIRGEIDDTPGTRSAEAFEAMKRKDNAYAVELLEPLARMGSTVAMAVLGRLFCDGEHGVKQDFDTAHYWSERALSEGKILQACLLLARMYFYGEGTPIDYKKSYEYYSFCADTDPPTAVALLRLGYMNQLGLGVEGDARKARDFYKQAANAGNVLGRRNWGFMEIKRGNLYGFFLAISGIVESLYLLAFKSDDVRIRGR